MVYIGLIYFKLYVSPPPLIMLLADDKSTKTGQKEFTLIIVLAGQMRDHEAESVAVVQPAP